MNNRCAGCGLVNFATEQACRRCGAALAVTAPSAFVNNPTTDALPQMEGSGRHIRRMIYGLFWAVGGSAVTLGSYLSAASNPNGGRYFVAWGAMIFGVVDFFIGLNGLMKQRSL